MARRSLTVEAESNPNEPGIVKDSLKDVCSSYIHNKAEADKYSKLAKSDNESIKEQMTKLKITSCDTDDGTVKMTEEVRKSFREDDLIKYLKDNGVADGIVKMKECVDFDALESAIYHETLSKEVVSGMSSCEDKTVIVKLRISKKKGD